MLTRHVFRDAIDPTMVVMSALTNRTLAPNIAQPSRPSPIER
jgi:hypothetical protein